MEITNKFEESRWYQVSNGWVGLTAILFALIFFIVVIVIYIIRAYQSRKNLFSESFSFLTGDARSSVAKFLRATIFIILALGFFAVVYYNINKMARGAPKVTLKVEDNKESPSIIFRLTNSIIKASYYETLEDYAASNSDSVPDKALVDLTNSFNNITLGEIPALFFNETLSTKPKEKIGGIYSFLLQFEGEEIDMFICDFTDIDTSRLYPQGKAHSSIGMQVINHNTGYALFSYEETRFKNLDGGIIHRSFKISPAAAIDSTETEVVPGTIQILLIAPNEVVINEEEPPIDLADFFGNIGGYLSLWGIFGFLFGSGKMNPFGFVTQYCFQYKDLDKDLETDNDLEEGNETNSEKDKEAATDESKFEKTLKKYYIDMI